jgi:hypothetical protein
VTKLSPGSVSRYFNGSDTAIGSNYGEMAERAALDVRRHSSVKCRACNGEGFLILDERERNIWKRRIEEAEKRYLQVKAEISKALLDGRAIDPQKELDAAADRIAAQREGMCKASDCKVCATSGYVTARRADMAHAMDEMFTTVRCSRCRATGTARVGYLQPATTTENAKFQEFGYCCDRCGGAAYIIPVTAKEQGSSKGGKPPKFHRKADPDDFGDGTNVAPSFINEDLLAERGRTSRVLEAIRRSNPKVYAAMSHYNGPDGDRWGAHRYGRIFALWQDTAAGRQLAELGANRSKGGHGHLIPPLDLIATERETEFQNPNQDPRRRALIGQADRQARELHRSMLDAQRDAESAA